MLCRVIDRHANVCAECEGRRKQRLSPAAMFAALPILSLPALKAKVAAALMAQGAPMQGSTAPADAAAHPATTELHPMSRAVNHTGRWRRFALGAVAAAAVILFATWVGASRLDDNSADLVRDTHRGADRRHIRDDLDDHHDHRRRIADVADRAEPDRVTTRDRRPDRSTGDGPTGDQPTGGDDRTATASDDHAHDHPDSGPARVSHGERTDAAVGGIRRGEHHRERAAVDQLHRPVGQRADLSGRELSPR